MKKFNLKQIVLSSIFICGLQAQAEIMQDFDSLGGNNVLLEKVKDMNPDTKVSVVQERIVNRRNRVEISPEFASVVGGDAYTATRNYGINLNYHITPHWSLGLKYEKSYNKLTSEGNNLIDQAKSTGAPVIPDIDYVNETRMALVNWYPIYGKMNLYDLGIVHFDIYAIGGYGQISLLQSGTKPTYTAGAGFGMWFSQHLTSRLEARYQTYQATRHDEPQNMGVTILSFQMGYLL